MARTNTTSIKFIALAVAVLVTTALLPDGVEAQKRRGRKVADGVHYRLYRWSKPNKIRVVTFNPSAAPTIDTVLGSGKLPGRERTSSMARRTGALVAINGDYSQPSGRPVFTFAQDGRLEQTPKTHPDGSFEYGRNFSLDINESLAFFDNPKTRSWVWDPKFGEAGSHEIERVNDGSLPDDAYTQLRAYTPAGGKEEKPPPTGCYVRLKASGPPEPADFTSAPVNNRGQQIATVGVEQPHFVSNSKCGGAPLYPRGGITLYAPKSGLKANTLRSMHKGDEVVYGWSLRWPDVFDTIGGNPTLIEDGVVQRQSINDGSSFASGVHPRTAIAYNARNGKLFLVTVDGRQPKYSVGMSLTELTSFLRKRLGATDALNLDGGGSTTMVVKGNVKGRPSDGSERSVSSALVILPGRDPGERFGDYPSPPPPSPTPTPTPTISPSPPTVGARTQAQVTGPIEVVGESSFDEMVTDPASVGGLAVYLERRGYELPGFLERSARAFRASR